MTEDSFEGESGAATAFESYLEWHTRLTAAIRSKHRSAVEFVTKEMRERLQQIEAETKGQPSRGGVPAPMLAARPIGFALATVVSARAYKSIDALASSPNDAAIFEPEAVAGRRVLRTSVREELTVEPDAWRRVSDFEEILVALGNAGVARSFVDVPSLLEPVYETYEHYTEWVPRIATREMRKEFPVITPQQLITGSIREGALKVNRFAELVGRMHVQFGDVGGDRGVRKLFDHSSFPRASALQAPGANLSCHKVLVGCETECFSKDTQTLLDSTHGGHLQAALDSAPPEKHSRLITGFRTSHHRALFYDAAFWTVKRNTSGFLEVTPAVDLSETADPETGKKIGSFDIPPNEVIGCAAALKNSLSLQLALHADAFDQPAVWGELIKQYRGINKGRRPRSIESGPILPLPVSRDLGNQSGLTPTGIDV